MAKEYLPWAGPLSTTLECFNILWDGMWHNRCDLREEHLKNQDLQMGAIPTIDTSKGCWIETPSKAPQIETPLKILVYIYFF